MSKTNRFFMSLAWHLPALSALNLRLLAFVIRRNPLGYVDSLKYKVHDKDKAILTRPEIREMLATDFREALRHGAQGMMSDMSANHGRPWGFPLDEIKANVLLWFCELDRSVPPAMGRYLRTTVPHCRAEFVRDAGHLWILMHLREVLTTLAGRQDSNEPFGTARVERR